jgi:hypothetical protein
LAPGTLRLLPSLRGVARWLASFPVLSRRCGARIRSLVWLMVLEVVGGGRSRCAGNDSIATVALADRERAGDRHLTAGHSRQRALSCAPIGQRNTAARRAAARQPRRGRLPGSMALLRGCRSGTTRSPRLTKGTRRSWRPVTATAGRGRRLEISPNVLTAGDLHEDIPSRPLGCARGGRSAGPSGRLAWFRACSDEFCGPG